MGHYSLAVITKEKMKDKMEAQVHCDVVMAPYCEETDEPHITKCDECDGSDETCVMCKGTGEYETYINDIGMWDWFQIGGQYSGMFGEQPPKELSPTEIFFDEVQDCDISTPVQTILDGLKEEKMIAPFAILTPGGEWISRYDLDPVDGLEPTNMDAWNKRCQEIFSQYKDCHVTTVDYHC